MTDDEIKAILDTETMKRIEARLQEKVIENLVRRGWTPPTAATPDTYGPGEGPRSRGDRMRDIGKDDAVIVGMRCFNCGDPATQKIGTKNGALCAGCVEDPYAGMVKCGTFLPSPKGERRAFWGSFFLGGIVSAGAVLAPFILLNAGIVHPAALIPLGLLALRGVGATWEDIQGWAYKYGLRKAYEKEAA